MELKSGYKCLALHGSSWVKAEIVSVTSTEVYLHFEGYNKRLDQWVAHHKIDYDSIKAPLVLPPVPKVYSGCIKRKKEELLLDKPNQLIQTDDIVHTFSKENELEKLRTQGSMTQSKVQKPNKRLKSDG
jgi:hypothetical protein